MFKGLIFITPTFYQNMNNGFSGIAMFDDFYYSLYNVMLTTFSVGGFILLDQDHSFNREKFVRTKYSKVTRNPNYDPTKG